MRNTLTGGASAVALAVRNNELYVYRDSHLPGIVIDVYDTAAFDLRRRLNVTGVVRCVTDMASCPACPVVYVADRCSRTIHAVDEHGGLAAQWHTGDVPQGVSVNFRSNVVVTFGMTRRLREYTPAGRLVNEVSVQQDVVNPKHAVQLDDDQYAVVHGLWADPLHRVCLVDGLGTVTRAFGGSGGPGARQLNTPRHLALYGGSMVVADYMNYRLVALNATSLGYDRELVETRGDGQHPVKMAVDQDAGRLYASFEGTGSPVVVYDLL